MTDAQIRAIAYNFRLGNLHNSTKFVAGEVADLLSMRTSVDHWDRYYNVALDAIEVW